MESRPGRESSGSGTGAGMPRDVRQRGQRAGRSPWHLPGRGRVLAVLASLGAGDAAAAPPRFDPVYDSEFRASDGVNRDWFGIAASGGGDFDDDGFDDVIVGAPNGYVNASDAGKGAAYVYYGSVSGIAAGREDKLVQVSDVDTHANAGSSLAVAGDLDADGCSDVVVGAELSDVAWVYFGSPSGIDTSREAILHESGRVLGWSVARAGDIDADGYSDLLVNAPEVSFYGGLYVYYGGSMGIDPERGDQLVPSDNDYFGARVSGTGDIDGDGFGDLIAGHPGSDVVGATGSTYVYHGAAGGIDAASEYKITASDGHDGDQFGYAVAGAGDVNGDGFGDVIVGAPGDDEVGDDAGSIYLYLGGAVSLELASERKLTALAAPEYGEFGLAVAGVGDVDADGFDDVGVGRSYLLQGSAAGIDGSTEVRLTASGGDLYVLVGGIAGAGDVNADGFADVVGGSLYDAAAYVYHGGPDIDSDGDGIYSATDCDDANPSIGAAYIPVYADADADGYGDPANSLLSCGSEPGYAATGDDCNDAAAGVHPGAPDAACDGLDQDCDGVGGPDGDEDGDGLTFAEERTLGSDPCSADAGGTDTGSEKHASSPDGGCGNGCGTAGAPALPALLVASALLRLRRRLRV